MRTIIVIVAVLSVFNSNAQTNPTKLIANKDDNTLLWQVSGNGLKHPSYLFGTFHLLCKDDIHFSNQLKEAVANADEIYMELNMSDPYLMTEMYRFMYMKGNKKLKDFYTDSEYNRLSTYINDSLNTPLQIVESAKPYFLMSLLYQKMLPCKSVTGIEESIVALAKDDKKPINGLETMKFQASLFDSIPYKEQATDLLNSIDSINYYSVEFNEMLQLYLSQQLNKIGEEINKTEFGLKEHDDILLDDRNKNWVKKLKNIMPAKSVFVAVGCGHLVGKNGLIALLKKDGYTITPLLNK